MHVALLFFLYFFSAFVYAAPETQLLLYRPYGDMINQAVPQVQAKIEGQCLSQSHLIVREDAWRCEAQGKIYDPCFVKAGEGRREALCPLSPWNGSSVLIHTSSDLDNRKNQSLDMSKTYPWALELLTGTYCMATKNTAVFDDMPIRYHCDNGDVLLGNLHRCESSWTILKKNKQGLETAVLRSAWF